MILSIGFFKNEINFNVSKYNFILLFIIQWTYNDPLIRYFYDKLPSISIF